ncbi:hypothetical protein [Streptomyces malaysiensis]|nr:hypothetical protein [Streptomyces malaysiensis]
MDLHDEGWLMTSVSMTARPPGHGIGDRRTFPVTALGAEAMSSAIRL